MSSGEPAAVTELLHRWSDGDAAALEALMPLVYAELRRIARREIASGHDQTLQPTALVHEAYIRLTRGEHVQWQGRSHFFAVACKAMRQVLVDHARRRDALKRGGGNVTIALDAEIAWSTPAGVDVIALDGALERLAALHPVQSRIVELRFFGGLTLEEVAALLESSEATVKRKWRMARAWLYRELTAGAA